MVESQGETSQKVGSERKEDGKAMAEMMTERVVGGFFGGEICLMLRNTMKPRFFN